MGAGLWLVFVPEAPPLLVLDGYEYRIGDPHSAAGREAIDVALALRSEQLLSQEISIRADEEVVQASALDLGYRLDLEGAREEALSGLERVHVAWTENFGVWLVRRFSSTSQTFALPLRFSLDQKTAEARLSLLSDHVAREPEDAQMLISEHKILPSREGRRLSVAATLVRMDAQNLDEALFIEAALDRVPPRVTEAQLAPVDVTRVLASYETSFRGKAGARAVNIRTAGKYLNGAILLPGEVLSFNSQVGRRIPGRGFVDAPVIMNDELELDVGGGVCQVATTLHAAAVFGNLEIVQRRSHSRPSGYAPLGLDATVIDGKVDLQLRNPFDEPILVHVSFPSAYVIKVELLGRDPDAKVEHAYTVTHREPFARRIWHKEEAPLGGFEQKQKGSEGMDVTSVLQIKQKDGTTVRRTYHSKYYPVPEVFWVAEGTSPDALPELPEAAVGVVINGEELEPRPSVSTDFAASQLEVPSLSDADGSSQKPTRAPRDTN
jgi:vancomycin resistance protein YoaR